MLLANASVDVGKRIAIIAAALSFIESSPANESTYEMLESVHYDAVSTVMRQCDEQGSISSARTTVVSSSVSVSLNYRRHVNTEHHENRNRMTRKQIKQTKDVRGCNKHG